MKRIVSIIFVSVFAVMLFAGCSGGNVWGVDKKIGDSDVYSRNEINSAMNKVIDFFDRNFDGCTLLELCYDEEFSNEYASDWAEQYDADRAIVLTSSFYVDDPGDGSLNPNTTYERYQWILVRSWWNGWELKTWGYG